MTNEQVKVFKAFCEVKRLEILYLLKHGEQCACTLLEKLSLTQSGLSYHMKVLIDSGIVLARQEGKWVYYRLSEEGKKNAIAILEDLLTPVTKAKTCCEK